MCLRIHSDDWYLLSGEGRLYIAESIFHVSTDMCDRSLLFLLETARGYDSWKGLIM